MLPAYTTLPLILPNNGFQILNQSQSSHQKLNKKLFKEVLSFHKMYIFHVKKRVCDSQCGASRSLRDQRSCPPWPGQRPLDVCWNQWPAGLPACWDGHWAAMCTWSVHRLVQICTSFPLEKRRKWRQHKRRMLTLHSSNMKHWLSTPEHYYHSKSSIYAVWGEHRRPVVFHCAE